MDIIFTKTRKPMRKISLVPMINVIFMLIFFFLVGGHLQPVNILEVDLPDAASGTMLDQGPIEVLLGKYDEIIINDVLYSKDNALAALQQQLDINPERIVTIKADARSSANKLVAFMELARLAGGQNLSLVTQKTDAQSPQAQKAVDGE
jgi:biopolymer transport protein ExbD